MKIKMILLALIFTLYNTSSFANENSKVELQQLLDANKGKVIYLDFWASWCIPCRKSFPWMNEMEAKYKDQGFKVITINLDVEKKLAEEFLIENPAIFTVIYDPKGTIAKEFKLKGMPSSYIIGKDGQPKSAHVGFFNDKKPSYEAELLELIKN